MSGTIGENARAILLCRGPRDGRYSPTKQVGPRADNINRMAMIGQAQLSAGTVPYGDVG